MPSVNLREVSTFSKDLRKSATYVQFRARAVVKKGAVNIKAEARKLISDAMAVRSSIGNYPATIDFDLSNAGMQADIGPDRNDNEQAKLGNLLEYGGEDNGPIPHLQPALDHEVPRFEQALADEAARIW